MNDEFTDDSMTLLIFVSALFFVGAGLLLFLDFRSTGITGAAVTAPVSLTGLLGRSNIVEWLTLLVSFAVFVMAIKYVKEK